MIERRCHPSKYTQRYGGGYPKYLVIHSTAGNNSLDWLTKPVGYGGGWVSCHYLVDRNGIIYKMVDEDKRAWHVGYADMPDGETDGNSWSIGIELENNHRQPYTEKQMKAAANLASDIIKRYNIPGDFVVSHASVAVPKGRKIDPWKFNWAYFWDLILVHNPYGVSKPEQFQFTKHSEWIDMTGDEHFLKAVRKLQSVPTGEYTDYDVSLIAAYYNRFCKEAGFNRVLVLAQMCLETANLTSWWAARPRRNPAGIGVTGEPGAGHSFATWRESVQAHVGHLLHYTTDPMTPNQYEISRKSPRGHLVYPKGKAKTLNDLSGRWAVDPLYGEKIAARANWLISEE